MCVFFFFQAEDGIRDATVTGVQTCALPISQGRLLFEIKSGIPVQSNVPCQIPEARPKVIRSCAGRKLWLVRTPLPLLYVETIPATACPRVNLNFPNSAVICLIRINPPPHRFFPPNARPRVSCCAHRSDVPSNRLVMGLVALTGLESKSVRSSS